MVWFLLRHSQAFFSVDSSSTWLYFKSSSVKLQLGRASRICWSSPSVNLLLFRIKCLREALCFNSSVTTLAIVEKLCRKNRDFVNEKFHQKNFRDYLHFARIGCT